MFCDPFETEFAPVFQTWATPHTRSSWNRPPIGTVTVASRLNPSVQSFQPRMNPNVPVFQPMPKPRLNPNVASFKPKPRLSEPKIVDGKKTVWFSSGKALGFATVGNRVHAVLPNSQADICGVESRLYVLKVSGVEVSSNVSDKELTKMIRRAKERGKPFTITFSTKNEFPTPMLCSEASSETSDVISVTLDEAEKVEFPEPQYKPSWLNPEEILFSQDLIEGYFKPESLPDGCEKLSVHDTVLQLRINPEKVREIPRISVCWSKSHGRWMTKDNRRLYCFRMARVKNIPVFVTDQPPIDYSTDPYSLPIVKSRGMERQTSDTDRGQSWGLQEVSSHYDAVRITIDKRRAGK